MKKKLISLMLIPLIVSCKQNPAPIIYNEDKIFNEKYETGDYKRPSYYERVETKKNKEKNSNLENEKYSSKQPSYLNARKTENNEKVDIIEEAPYESKQGVTREYKEKLEENKQETINKEEPKTTTNQLVERKEDSTTKKIATEQQPEKETISETKIQNYKYIVVKRDNTLSEIAAENDISTVDLAKLNNINPPYKIYVGQKLRVPINNNNSTSTTKNNKNTKSSNREEFIKNGFRYVVVEKGDSLLRIAIDYNKKLTEIAKLNNIEYPYNIKIDQKIKIERVGNSSTTKTERNIITKNGRKYITIQKGDTLIELARDYNTTLLALAELNNLEPPHKLYIGQRLQISGPNERKTSVKHYKVEQGDTLYGIARKFDVNINGLINENNLKAPYNIYAGQRLNIPSGKSNYSIEKTASLSETREGNEESQTQQVVTKPTSNGVTRVTTKKVDGFIWPIKGDIVSTFGKKEDGTYNDGIKIKAAKGTPVKASFDGEVAYAGNELKGYGNIIILRHSNGWLSIYAHCDTINVNVKDRVNQGDSIATVGNTGNVDTPQLYFGLRKGRTAVDPVKELK